jgi:RNA recognition motif-containing protein
MLMQGYGTVKFTSAELAQKAIEDFNGWELEGRSLTVKMDQFA